MLIDVLSFHDDTLDVAKLTCWLDGFCAAALALPESREAVEGPNVRPANFACATKLSKSSSLDAYATPRSACCRTPGVSTVVSTGGVVDGVGTSMQLSLPVKQPYFCNMPQFQKQWRVSPALEFLC